MTNLVCSRIIDNWESYFAKYGKLSRGDLLGILRTLLGSLEIWTRRGGAGRGYLNMVADMMKRTGAFVQRLTTEEAESLMVIDS